MRYYRVEGRAALDGDTVALTYDRAFGEMRDHAVERVAIRAHHDLSDHELLAAHGLLEIDTTQEADLELTMRLIRLLAGM